MPNELGYQDNPRSIAERFGKKMERLKFEDMVRHAAVIYRRKLARPPNNFFGDWERQAAVEAVNDTFGTFRSQEWNAAFRATLILQATARGRKSRIPEVQALFGEVLAESKPWVSSTEYTVAAMLLRRVNPRARFNLA